MTVTVSNAILAERVAVLTARLHDYHAEVEQLEAEVDELERNVAQMKTDAVKRENSLLLWGIMALGSVVVTLGSLLWHYVTQGRP